MDPCQQSGNISDLGKKIDRIIDVMTQVSVQKSEIEHLAEAVKELREWNRGQEKRIQTLEKQPGNSALKMLWSFASPLSAAIVTWLLMGSPK